MIPFLLMLATPAAIVPATEADRLRACLTLAQTDAAKAVTDATAWAAAGGGIAARHCLGTAETARENFAPAAKAYEEAAQLADAQHWANAATYWTAAGNAALAAGEAGRARDLLGKALAHDDLTGPYRGETLLDRGRAAVQAGDPVAARTDIDEALKLVEKDPMAWLLSATLARRQGDGDRAEKDIQQAVLLAPDAAPVAYEAGNVAAMLGAVEAARVAWTRAVAADPGSDAGRAAQTALARLDRPAETPPARER